MVEPLSSVIVSEFVLGFATCSQAVEHGCDEAYCCEKQCAADDQEYLHAVSLSKFFGFVNFCVHVCPVSPLSDSFRLACQRDDAFRLVYN